MDESVCWRAVQIRDRDQDGKFVYAVRTTGIFCRPSCASRQPRREHVLFFATPEDALAAGFRPCKRCRPLETSAPDDRVWLVRQACSILEEEKETVLTLQMLARRLNISPTYLHRVFKEVTGMTPRQYTSLIRAEAFKSHLRKGARVIEAQFEAGYTSSSRVVEASDRWLGMTPGQYRKGGKGMELNYAIVESWMGRLLVAATHRGVCAVRFGEGDNALLAGLREEFPSAELVQDRGQLQDWVQAILAHLEGREKQLDLPLDIRATAFQWEVWEALRRIPYGETRTYRQVAESIGKPSAVRAVANACAANPVAVVIPCHRVKRSDGGLGGYRWGIQRKQALLEKESEVASA
ncbi:MAG TPA: bifunctional DNA-binding transcriptional regulator/O6-methylguanine-DNA methyltransferase Ada [Anaerolinea thermolimosa]|uniref:methylated-DNA--[protein]-cysteine S-methyltransferase n=2 Tax=Anaerolinea thermolimosa TaxID=229919 RepID=A0A3D1JLX0_9CHLR|nr:bifunctional DNA-binding transcriptional regulator/O6-methylguanine-DNA methyltransferase Ada [Anaerolinea thermolimosa]